MQYWGSMAGELFPWASEELPTGSFHKFVHYGKSLLNPSFRSNVLDLEIIFEVFDTRDGFRFYTAKGPLVVSRSTNDLTCVKMTNVREEMIHPFTLKTRGSEYESVTDFFENCPYICVRVLAVNPKDGKLSLLYKSSKGNKMRSTKTPLPSIMQYLAENSICVLDRETSIVTRPSSMTLDYYAIFYVEPFAAPRGDEEEQE